MVGLEMNNGQEKQGNRKTLDVTKPLGKQQLRMQHVETEGENYGRGADDGEHIDGWLCC